MGTSRGGYQIHLALVSLVLESYLLYLVISIIVFSVSRLFVFTNVLVFIVNLTKEDLI